MTRRYKVEEDGGWMYLTWHTNCKRGSLEIHRILGIVFGQALTHIADTAKDDIGNAHGTSIQAVDPDPAVWQNLAQHITILADRL
jgi:hypothetical protein